MLCNAQTIGNNVDLKELDLGMNKISAAGTEELAKAFPVNTLVYVDMQGNPVGNAGALLKEEETTMRRSKRRQL